MYRLFRVFDDKKKCWVQDDIYLSHDGELFLIKRPAFGLIKMPLALSQDRYIYHESINLQDKNGEEVYEGDYILAKVDEDRTVVGLVVFAQELSAYIILCVDSDEFYTLGNAVTEFIEVIGNVFDGYEEVKQDGESTLQGTEE